MELSSEQKAFIGAKIKENSRFSGNEDLYEDFHAETIKRSYQFLSAIKDISLASGYLNKVAASSIIEVLKQSGRIKRTTKGYKKVQEVPLIVPFESESSAVELEDPFIDVEKEAIIKEEIYSILKKVYEIDSKNPEKNYFELFKLKYKENLTQVEIAQKLDLSQSEVSKRLMKLAIGIENA